MLKVAEFLEDGLYLSLYDRNFREIPEYVLPSYLDFPDPVLCKTAYKAEYTVVYDLLKSLQDSSEKDFSEYPQPTSWPTNTSGNTFDIFLTNVPEAQYQKAYELYADQYLGRETLTSYIPLAKKIVSSVSNRNGGFSHHTYPLSLIQYDESLDLSFIEPSGGEFYDICSVNFRYGGTTYSLYLLPLGEFLSNASSRASGGFPYVYNYNIQANRLYVYPNPSISGDLVIFGKKNFGGFSNLDDDLSAEISDSFLQYATYLLGKELCAQHNVPWQAQKESSLLDHKKNIQFEGGLNFNDRANLGFLGRSYSPYYRTGL